MREMGLIHKPHRKPKGLTKATTEVQERENLIKQDFSADRPLKKLLTDISQIQCEDGKLLCHSEEGTPVSDSYMQDETRYSQNNNLQIRIHLLQSDESLHFQSGRIATCCI